MPIPLDDARQLIIDGSSPELRQLIAQAEAQHILFEVGEAAENFPPVAEGLDDRVTSLAYLYISAGCSLVEQGHRDEGNGTLERGARLLRSVHGPHARTSRDAAFHTLIASMSAYSTGQYSWAFVLLQHVERHTPAAAVIACFLRRERHELQQAISAVLYETAPSPGPHRDQIEVGIERAIVRAVALATEFLYSGEHKRMEQARAELADATELAFEGSSPGWWLVTRLLRLMVRDLEDASPWTVIPPFFPQHPPEGAPSIERYVQQLACDRRPVFELWRSQRDALPQALGVNPGAVVSLRTSAGKTRVAELAILQTLSLDPEGKVLYLAPFRSLAFELEQALSRALPDVEISHLYGGARASRTDAELASEAAIIIATPEKSRALFRANPELFTTIKLIVVDEGHLLSSGERDVRNELYLEHLRVRARASGARLLLLSAVLPNADEIAAWIAGSGAHVAASTWRPSLQRFGMLRWNGTDVRLEWFGEHNSLNPHFVTAAPVSTHASARNFPNTRAQAVGAAALRLWSRDRPVMIFVSQARWVPGVAKGVLEAIQLFGLDAEHTWPELEWKVFAFLCEEELPPGSIELRAAAAGIICHSNSLPSQVRLAMEHLMRSTPPRVIIATSTLAQGVNIGVNTVIIHSSLIGHNHHLAGAHPTFGWLG